MFAVHAGHTMLAIHPYDRTMFIVFKNKDDAVCVKKAIFDYVREKKTLPPMYEGATGPVELKEPEKYKDILSSLYVNAIDMDVVKTQCEVHQAGVYEIAYITNVGYEDGEINLAMRGTMHPPTTMDIDDYRTYLDYYIS